MIHCIVVNPKTSEATAASTPSLPAVKAVGKRNAVQDWEVGAKCCGNEGSLQYRSIDLLLKLGSISFQFGTVEICEEKMLECLENTKNVCKFLR